MSQYMRKGYLSHRQPEKALASLRISAISPEPLLKQGSGRTRMSVALVGDSAFAFEEPQTVKP